MKVTYTTNNGRMKIELEADTQKALVKQLAAFSEVFEEDHCGKCNSTVLKWVVRVSQNKKGQPVEYNELHCKKCGAKLSFGILNDGSSGLFPKRKDADGKIKGKWGWTKWNPNTEKEE